MNHNMLSKEISYALRHSPDEYGLRLDDEGWVELSALIESLKKKNEFERLTSRDVYAMIELSDKKRHEIVGDKIRATYGHSIDKKIVKKSAVPPEVLYHGTARKFLEKILEIGLIPKKRQYVHLSEDIQTAITVGKRRDAQPVIIKIDSQRAYADGILFFSEANNIWLANSIPAEFLEIM